LKISSGSGNVLSESGVALTEIARVRYTWHFQVAQIGEEGNTFVGAKAGGAVRVAFMCVPDKLPSTHRPPYIPRLAKSLKSPISNELRAQA